MWEFKGFSALLPGPKKSAKVTASRVRSCLRRSAHGRRLITPASSLMRRLLHIWPALSWSPTCGGMKRGMCGCISLQTRHGGTCCRIQRCTGMSLGDEAARAAFSPLGVFLPVFVQRARVLLHAPVYGGFWVNFLHFLLARITWKFGAFFRPDVVSGSNTSAMWTYTR